MPTTDPIEALDSIFRRGLVSQGLESACGKRQTKAQLQQAIAAMTDVAREALLAAGR